MFSALQLSAQVTPCFDAAATRGCAPFQLDLINCSSGNVSLYIITGPNSSREELFGTTITLSSPGTYSVEQRVGTGGGTGGTTSLVKTDYIEVLSSPSPLYTVKICEGRKIEIHTVTGQYEEYIITPGDGGPSVTVAAGNIFSHTYTTDTDKTLTVKGNYNPGNCGGTATSLIKPFVTLQQPSISSVQAEDGKIRVSFSTDARFKYRLLESAQSGPYTIIDSIRYEAGNQTIDLNRNTENRVYTYLLETYDDCGKKSSSIPINTLLPVIENKNKEVSFRISQSSLSNFDKVIIYKNNILLQEITSNNLNFDDPFIECGVKYCYRIEGVKGATRSTVTEQCVIGQNIQTPAAITSLNSSFEQNSIVLSWSIPSTPFKTQRVYLNKDATWEEINQTTSSKYVLQNPDPDNSYCFQIDYTDQCDNVSQMSQNTCPITLKMSKNGNAYILHWNSYSGSGTPSTYMLVKYNENNDIINQFDVSGLSSYTDPLVDDGGIFYYQIVSSDMSGFSSHSNVVEAREELTLFVPTAFTPNGDGQNDVFRIKGKYVKSFSMTIYNNWGEAIFHSDTLAKTWNGKKYTEDAPSGVYSYIIEATDYQGNIHNQSGTITLIR